MLIPTPLKPTVLTSRQGGAALLAALIFLVVLTILGVGVVGTTTTEEKLARNFRDNDIAFAAAEAALRDAEVRITGYFKKPSEITDYLTDFSYLFRGDCTDGLCKLDDIPADKRPVYDYFSLTEAPSAALGTVTGTPEIKQVSAQPRYLMERTCGRIPGESATKCQTYYRITAIGFGRLSAQSIVQETYLP